MRTTGMLREVFEARELLATLVKRDLKARYKSSVLGFFWSFAKPLLLMLVLLIVFSVIMRFNILREWTTRLPYAMHLLAGVLAWTFFAGGLLDAMHSILANADLIKKVKVPIVVFPLSTVASHLVHYLLGLIVLLIFMIFFRIPFTLYLLLLPGVIVLQVLLMIGLALIVSSLNVFYRDVASISEVLLSLWFYLTPILYPAFLAAKELQGWGAGLFYLYMLNPMAPIVVAYRAVVYHGVLKGAPEITPAIALWGYLALALVVIAIVMFIGRSVFRHYERKFADEL
jgi:lipopolysaccharide transport system permease protein